MIAYTYTKGYAAVQVTIDNNTTIIDFEPTMNAKRIDSTIEIDKRLKKVLNAHKLEARNIYWNVTYTHTGITIKFDYYCRNNSHTISVGYLASIIKCLSNCFVPKKSQAERAEVVKQVKELKDKIVTMLNELDKLQGKLK